MMQNTSGHNACNLTLLTAAHAVWGPHLSLSLTIIFWHFGYTTKFCIAMRVLCSCSCCFSKDDCNTRRPLKIFILEY